MDILFGQLALQLIALRVIVVMKCRERVLLVVHISKLVSGVCIWESRGMQIVQCYTLLASFINKIGSRDRLQYHHIIY